METETFATFLTRCEGGQNNLRSQRLVDVIRGSRNSIGAEDENNYLNGWVIDDRNDAVTRRSRQQPRDRCVTVQNPATGEWCTLPLPLSSKTEVDQNNKNNNNGSVEIQQIQQLFEEAMKGSLYMIEEAHEEGAPDRDDDDEASMDTTSSSGSNYSQSMEDGLLPDTNDNDSLCCRSSRKTAIIARTFPRASEKRRRHRRLCANVHDIALVIFFGTSLFLDRSADPTGTGRPEQ
jgi:hypothetical protein